MMLDSMNDTLCVTHYARLSRYQMFFYLSDSQFFINIPFDMCLFFYIEVFVFVFCIQNITTKHGYNTNQTNKKKKLYFTKQRKCK